MIKKQKKLVKTGVATIVSTLNNTIVSIADDTRNSRNGRRTAAYGKTLCWASGGTSGFKGAKKKTAYAGQLASQAAIQKAKEMEMKELTIVVRGRGKGRESALRILKNAGLKILAIEDHSPIPHNGCRPPKRRRL